jgi:hypothetical protein
MAYEMALGILQQYPIIHKIEIHLIPTNEQPEALAALIAKFERGLARMQPAPGN